MVVLVICIAIALALYIFYKTRYFRTNLPVEKKWLSAKSNIALGSFVLLFGINQLIIFHSTITYLISGIFILLGAVNMIGGYQRYKHYLPLAIKEAEQLDSM